jgi:hypothetical protein
MAHRFSVAAVLVALGGLAAHPAAAGPFQDVGISLSVPVEWADSVVSLVRGPEHLADPTSPPASFGSAVDALGPAEPEALDVLSLGEGGEIVLGFAGGIGDGEGPDFAVFENGFWTLGGLFAELAFVEVSSDGESFVRFPSVSLTSAPLAGFDPLDPSDVHALAGKHALGEGTGFDLAELADDPLVRDGLVTLARIFFVRLVDVIGDGSELDGQGQPIYDPFPTSFPSSGFDLDAVGVLHRAPEPDGLGLLVVGLGIGGIALRARRLRRGSGSPRPVWAGRSAALAGLALLHAAPAVALRIDLEDLALAPESFYDGRDGAGGFRSRGAFFNNRFTDFGGGFTAWSGFAYSNTTDTLTAGIENQHSAFAGGGAQGSSTYAVAFAFDPDFATVTLPAPRRVEGAYFTNTTFAALSMRDGDAFAKKFGGEDGSEPDFLSVTVTGLDGGGNPTGSVEWFLADFRFEDASLDFILDEWTFIGLNELGIVESLSFTMDSSDIGPFGINTPTYFALDDLLLVPEPVAGLMLALGIGIALGVRRRGP